MKKNLKKFRDDKISKSILIQYFSYFLKFLFLILIGGWTARYLGPNNLGKISIASTLVSLTLPFGALGMRGSLSGILTYSKNTKNLIGSALSVEIFGRGLLLLLIISISIFYKNNIIILLIVLYAFNSFLDCIEIFEVDILNDKKGSFLGKIGTLESVFFFIITAIFLLSNCPLLAFGSIPLLRNIFKATLIIFFNNTRNYFFILKETSIKTCKKLIRRGLPFILSSFSIAVAMKIDQLMIGSICGLDELGQYSVAIKVNQSLYFLPTILAQTFIPFIGKNTFSENNNATVKLYRYAWILGILITILGIFVFSNFIPLIFGDEFIKAKKALIFLAPSSFFVAIGCAQGSWLNVNNKEKVIASRTLYSLIINILMNAILLPFYGSYGAGIATTISQGSAIFSTMLYDKNVFNNAKILIFPWDLSKLNFYKKK